MKALIGKDCKKNKIKYKKQLLHKKILSLKLRKRITEESLMKIDKELEDSLKEYERLYDLKTEEE